MNKNNSIIVQEYLTDFQRQRLEIGKVFLNYLHPIPVSVKLWIGIILDGSIDI